MSFKVKCSRVIAAMYAVLRRRLMRRPSRWGWPDVALFLLIFSLTVIVISSFGMYQHLNRNAKTNFDDMGGSYMLEFIPHALSSYCGHGAHLALDCAPDSPWQLFYTAQPDPAHGNARFLAAGKFPDQTIWFKNTPRYFAALTSIPDSLAAWWHLTGVLSWDYLFLLIAIFVGVTNGMTFLLFRVFMGRILAFSLSLPVIFYHHNYITGMINFRDYSRGLFVIAALLLTGILLQRSFGWFKTCVVPILFGGLLGFGMGFRNDFIFILPFVGLALVIFGAGSWRARWLRKLIFILLFCGSFIGGSWNTYKFVREQGSGLYHIVHKGLSVPMDMELGIPPIDYYKWTVEFSDGSAEMISSSIAAYRQQTFAVVMEKSYDEALKGELLRLFRYFPSDVIGRAVSGTICLLRLPEIELLDCDNPYNGNHNRLVWRQYSFTHDYNVDMPFYPIKAFFNRMWHWISGETWVVFGLLTFLLVGAFDWRRALFLLLLTVVITGITTIEFTPRHHFYLYFLGLLCLGFLIQFAFRMLRRIYCFPRAMRNRLRRWCWKHSCLRQLAFTLIGAALLLLLWALVAVYQNVVLQKSFAETAKMEMAEVPFEIVELNLPKKPSLVLVSVPDMKKERFLQANPQMAALQDGATGWRLNKGWFSQFLVAEFDFQSLPDESVFKLSNEYGWAKKALIDYFSPRGNWSYQATLPVDRPGRYLFIIPVYYSTKPTPLIQYEGLVLDRKYLQALKSIKVITHPEKLFVHGIFWIPVDRKDFSLVRRIDLRVPRKLK